MKKYILNSIRINDIFSRLPWVPIIIGAGIITRLNGLGASGLWYDEVLSLSVTRQNIFTMVSALQINISPPGWEILQWFITRLLGWNEFSARIIPFIAGSASLFLIFEICNEFHFSRAQLISVLIPAAFLPYLLWMSQEGKVYTVFSLLYLTGILWALKGKWFGLTATMGLMLWCHNTAVLYIPALVLLAFITHTKDWKKILLIAFLALISWIPWIPTFFHQSTNGIRWLHQMKLNEILTNIYVDFFGWKIALLDPLNRFIVPAYLLFLIFSLVIALINPIIYWLLYGMKSDFSSGKLSLRYFYNKYLKQNDITETPYKRLTSLILLFIPVIIPFTAFITLNFLKQPVFYYKTGSLMIIPAIIWIVGAVTPSPIKIAQRIIHIGWIIIIFINLAYWSPKQKGGDILDVVQMMDKNWKNGDIIYHSSGTTGLLFWHYLPDKPQFLMNGQYIYAEDIQAAGILFPRANIDTLLFDRAWMIISKAEHIKMQNVSVFEQMEKYVKNCPLVGVINYPMMGPNEVYLCDHKTINKEITSGN